MVSCTVLNGDLWEIRDFCISLIKADSTHTDVIADVLAGILGRAEMQEARIAKKSGSGTCDGGNNLKCLMEALKYKVGCTDLLPNMVKPIASQCQPHLINTVSRFVDAGPKFSNYEVDRFRQLGFAKPTITITGVVAHFLSGTTLLKKSAPIWKEYSRLCRQFQMRPVVLRNPAATRWLSLVSYLLLLVQYRQAYDALWASPNIKPKHRRHAVSPEVWNLAETILGELLPLYRVIHRMQRGPNSYLLSDAISDAASLLILYQRRLAAYIAQGCSELDAEPASLRVHMCNNIVRSLKKNYSFFFEFDDTKEHYVFALLLDPRYLHLTTFCQVQLFDYDPWHSGPVDRVERVRELGMRYRDRLFQKAASAVTYEFQGVTPTPVNSLWSSVNPVRPPNAMPQVEMEWSQLCMVSPIFPLRFWPKFRATAPLLGKLAALYVTIKPSQVPVEGLFSAAGILTLDRRSRTGIDRLDNILYIWANLPRPEKRPSQKNKVSESTGNQAFRKQRIGVADPSTFKDLALPPQAPELEQAIEENSLLQQVHEGPNGFAVLPDHLDPVFDITDMHVKEVHLDLDDLLDSGDPWSSFLNELDESAGPALSATE